MSNILVTGGTGSIGSEVVKQLLAKGHTVTATYFSRKPERAPENGCTFVHADFTDPRSTSEAVRGHDLCIHLAAKIGGIGYFHKYPATILSENNKMYSNLFSAAVAEGIKRLVYVSSSMVFESATEFPTPESHIYTVGVPITAYGFSKLTGEWYCRAFHEEQGLEYAIARPFNAYGPLEAPGKEVGMAHVIPDLTKKILTGQYPLELLGDGTQTRCYTHVRDVADGIIAVMEHPQAANEDFNISTAEETPVRELSALLWKLTGQTKEFKTVSVPGFKIDVKRRVPNVEKAKQKLGWEARVSLEAGLPDVIASVRNILARS